MQDIVIVGAGQAGCSMAFRLRAEGYSGRLTLIGEEPAPPYQRPPLSKAYLLGELAEERLFLKPRAAYEEQGIELRLGTCVEGIDRAARTVTAGGETLPYDALALTTGAEPRRLPADKGGDLPGVHVVRGLQDIDTMKPGLSDGARALVVGGGYIGLEAAAVLRKLGLSVTLVEAAPRILGRVACEETADWFRALHESHGVDIREGAAIERLLGEERVTGARLCDGSEIAADLVIVGIGIAPATALAETVGLKVEGGIVVDEMGRTSDPAIWAAGDCTVFPYKGTPTRLESVQNAIDQAEAVARNILGADTPYVPTPWFWSDQYDVKLQIAGLNRGYTSVVRRGGGGSVSHWYFAGGDLLAVDAMNAPRDYMIGKRLIEAGRSPSAEAVADTGTDLKALLRP